MMFFDGRFPNRKPHCLPLDLKAHKKSKDYRVMSMNTHLINYGSGIAPWIIIDFIMGTPLLAAIGMGGLFTAWDLSDQIFAIDIFTISRSGKITTDFESTPVLAINDGLVVDLEGERKNKMGGIEKMFKKYGNFVIIDHGNFYSVYAHLQQNSLKVQGGQSVKRGQMIAKASHSGNSSHLQPHLHFELTYTNTQNKHRPTLAFDIPKQLSGFAPYDVAEIPWSVIGKGFISEKEGNKAFAELYDTLKCKSNKSGELTSLSFLT